jgi:molybdopterin-guanine dinucleotide biosynthesis protein A
MTVVAILMAGGESSRMGVPKPLLEWGGHTLIEYQLAQLEGPPIDRVAMLLELNQPREYQKARAGYFVRTGGLPGQGRPAG